MVIAKYLAPVLQFWFGETILAGSNFFGSAHGFERTRDDLRRAGAVNIVSRFRFEQLRMREDDPELIVQAVEKETKIR
jgi:hypothetical protein